VITIGDSEKFTSDFNSMLNIVIFNSMGFFFLDFLIPFIASQILNATGIEIGLIFSVQLFGFLISSSFTGFITDKIKSRKKLILLGSLGRGCGYFILYSAIILNTLIGMNVGTFTIGFFAGFFWIPLDTLIAEKSNKIHRSYAYGRRESAIGKGMLIGSIFGFTIFGFAISSTSNPFIIYMAIPLFGIANFYAGIRFYRNVDESIKFNQDLIKETEKKDVLTKVPRRMILGIMILMVVLILASINSSIGRPFFNVYILDEIVNDPIIAMIAFIPSGFVPLFLSPKLGRMVDKLHPAVGISLSSALGSLVTWILINSPNVIIFSLLYVLDVTIAAVGNLVFQNFLSRISIKSRGKVLGLRSFSSNFGGIIGPIIGGFLWDVLGHKAPFIVSILVELSLIPMYILAVYSLKNYLTETYDIKEKIQIEKI
jgi:MFS family permease